MSAKVSNTGDNPTILSGMSILEASRIICLFSTPPEDIEISMRVQVIYLDKLLVVMLESMGRKMENQKGKGKRYN